MVVLGKTNHHCLEILYGFVIDIRPHWSLDITRSVIGYGTKYLAFVTNLNNDCLLRAKRKNISRKQSKNCRRK